MFYRRAVRSARCGIGALWTVQTVRDHLDTSQRRPAKCRKREQFQLTNNMLALISQLFLPELGMTCFFAQFVGGKPTFHVTAFRRVVV